MNNQSLRFLLMVLIALTLSRGLYAQISGQGWAEQQQKQLAKEILTVDNDEFLRTLSVSRLLGADRIIDDVRLALIERLGRTIALYEEAAEEGIPYNDVFNGETYLDFCTVVASLKDERAIPTLLKSGKFGHNPRVAEGLAAFGEKAVFVILDFVRNPTIAEDALSVPLMALSNIAKDDQASDLSASAREHLRDFARSGLHSGSDQFITTGIKLAVSLNDPDLIREIEVLAHDRGMLSERGLSNWEVDWINLHAVEALETLRERE
ncbi:MAG: hypothetical protein OXE81_09810 [Gammaproteobacteria bacterium]|nr:hypothetical protein [Gammaproteobacteria bacterium]